jgi:capsular exopolysaccharide synthesis family protein
MHNPERPDGALAPWTPQATPATYHGGGAGSGLAAGWEDPGDDSGKSPSMFSPRVIARALKRHWWQILALWAVTSAGLIYLASTRIKPMYEASTLLEFEPTSAKIFAQTGGTGADSSSYMDTQVLLVTSPEVLSLTLTKPAVLETKKVKNWIDPDVELRKEIAVGIPQKGTHLIQVKMTGEDPKEAATIVNGVVEAYMEVVKKWAADGSKEQIDKFGKLEKDYQADVDALQKKVRELTRKNAEDVPAMAAKEAAKGDAKDPKEAGAGRFEITMDQFRTLSMALLNLEIERHQAEATVNFLQEEMRQLGGPSGSGPLTKEQVDEQVRLEFSTLPEVGRLMNDVKLATKKYDAAMRRVRNGLDPTVKRAKLDMDDAEAAYQEYWAKVYPRLKNQVMALAAAGPKDSGAASREDALSTAKLQLEKIKLNEKLLEKRINDARVEVKKANSEILDVKFAEKELATKESALEKIRAHKEQLELERDQDSRVKQLGQARVPKAPSSDNRMKVMLAAPVIMLMLSSLLFILLEFKSGRVADPDELSQRIRVGVIGVVPPLPSLNSPGRSLSARGQRDERRRVEEFVQSLDQLRVTLCAHRPGVSDRRCILITSATGGEGKTTLAAQLAGRCANAGLMTLLIDADLRRPSLGDLLEVPEGPGLVDVLSGDAAPEVAMVVIGNAGGFHLLPAGTLGQDPSRLLHGERLGKLIAQFRETFDMVIIDAPPVLAVPDALLLGRWTDGAVLAVRHDTSRFPLVERANRRLSSVGVSVLGAVVNGCRTMESSYGSYRYTPYAAADAPGGEIES